ncbi:membrane protein insertion efficiency factor YidD [Parachlamydia sp. AcF125]|uniref:membrane protein insertion efficiency factor YidD n=1 Tax=Parachlamydia sp. AcF125 TaxID=2795736 RepID=UPI001BC9E2F2|nr:membrane protein insertion efficiency factor YidD [Parachlamydia sp. AcF125]MBS4168175.1 putative membrane protein insertion efficiency factor [Parachlamydia sp. AcF125]
MPKRLVFLCCLAISSFLQANPWGKDADLACKQIAIQPQAVCKTPLLGYVGEKIIQFHQKVISPADGPRSHFIPSSSQYMLDAMRKYGFFQGFAMGCDRLMRENDDRWVYPTTSDAVGNLMKWDPVP